jgi:serine/threonine-protein kinase
VATLTPSSILGGKYRLVRPLGKGGMGEVWVAENAVLHKRVALKVIADEAAASPFAVERFLREAVTASRVHHPAIVEIHDAGVDQGVPWMAMELLEGESLADRIARRPLSVREAMQLLLPVVDALAALHDAGVIHRDLKPDNIFLEAAADGTTRPKLLDFGIAKSATLTRMTQTGELVGTGHYLSPEQARGARDVDARSDLYAMGVVFFESLSGRTPYEAESLPELIAKLFTEPPRSLVRLAPHVPESLARLVHRCLEREPAARPHDARTLATQLRAATTSSVPPPIPRHVRALAATARIPAPPVAPVPSTPPPRRAFDARSLLALFITLAATVLAFLTPFAAHWVWVTDHPPTVAVARAAPPPTSSIAPPPITIANANVAYVPPPSAVEPIAAPRVPRESTARTRAVVRTGEWFVDGPLRAATVRAAMRREVRSMERCIDEEPPATGRVAILFVVGENGISTHQEVESTTVDDRWVEACVLRAAATARFPSATEMTTVHFALVIDREEVSLHVPAPHDPLAGFLR